MLIICQLFTVWSLEVSCLTRYAAVDILSDVCGKCHHFGVFPKTLQQSHSLYPIIAEKGMVMKNRFLLNLGFHCLDSLLVTKFY